MQRLLSLYFLIIAFNATAQTDTPPQASIPEVTVQAFGANSLFRSPASIALLDSLALVRSAEFSIVPAVNRLPGVRMDERSPGSIRLSLRGSTLRSPFGVRNVKVYYDDIPLTDPGGHTYLNALTPAQIGRIEIAKGPAGSLYGAGTGGLLLVESPAPAKASGPRGAHAELRTLLGAYGHFQSSATASLRTEKTALSAQYAHRHLDGYRAQSALRHDAASLQASRALSQKFLVGSSLLFSRLFYQTPGALTADEARQAPRAARPAVGQTPGAEGADAHVAQQNATAGLWAEWRPSPTIRNKTIFYGAAAALDNPAIRNWGRVREAHGGLRSVWSYERTRRTTLIRLQAGGEYQAGRSDAQTFQNIRGTQAALQDDQRTTVHTGFLFTQLTLQSPRWTATAGLSANGRRLRFANRFLPSAPESTRGFGTEGAPRVAVAYTPSPAVTFYGSTARGFSPPALPELSPTGSGLNAALRAESGWNYEAGARGRLLQNKLRWEATAFFFRLQNAIVARRDAQGGDYFLNAGGTRQSGAEAAADAVLWRGERGTVAAWTAYTYYHFRYADFVQGGADFSGAPLPGASPHSGSAGVDVTGVRGAFLHLTYTAAGRQPLDDAADAWAEAYHLLGVRAGYRRPFARRFYAELSAGADNLLNASYSLGNDFNAFGGRFYNPAAGRSFYGGVVVGWRR